MLSPPGPQGRSSGIPCCYVFLLLSSEAEGPSSIFGICGEGQWGGLGWALT